MLYKESTSDTRRPRLLRHYKTPWGTFKPGELLEDSHVDEELPWALGDWTLDDEEIDSLPEWFEWAYFCGKCGEEQCMQYGDHPPCPEKCHGHYVIDFSDVFTEHPKSASRYPLVCNSEPHYWVSGAGIVNRCEYWQTGVWEFSCSGFPIWATPEDAEEFADEVKRLADMTAKRFQERDWNR